MVFKLIYLAFLVQVYSTKHDAVVKSSLTFVIDATRSMSDDIAQVKEGANLIFDAVLESKYSQIENFVLVTFRDPGFKLDIVTNDREAFKQAVSDITLIGNDDCPEMCMSGIELALKESLPGSYLYVFTDAGAKDHSKYEQVKSLAQKICSQIVFVLTGVCHNDYHSPSYVVYHSIAHATSGQVFHLGKTDVNKILKYVVETVKGRTTVIATKELEPGYGKNVTFPTDKHTPYVIISVTGDKPSIGVTDHEGGTPHTETVVDEAKIKIIKTNVTSPGSYTADVGSASKTSVTVLGGTTIDFQYGFSTFKPTNIKETVTRPQRDVKSYLSIKLNIFDGGDVKLTHVQILDVDGKVILEKLLEVLNEADRLYATHDLIESPKEMFRVKMVGYTLADNATITRMSPTLIEVPPIITVTENRPPKITIVGAPKMTVNYGEPLKLSCKANAYPQPGVTWQEESSGTILMSTLSILEPPYEYISILEIEKVSKSSTYTCKASNTNGVDSQTIAVEVPTHFNILETPKDAVVKYNTKKTFSCKIDALPPASIVWYKDGVEVKDHKELSVSTDRSTLTILHMSLMLQGNYECNANNGYTNGTYRFKVDISGVESPKIDKSVTKVPVKRESDHELICKIIEGIPTPKIYWQYKSKSAKKFKNITDINITQGMTLKFSKVNTLHAGSYKCAARNELGFDEHVLELEVQYPPKILKIEKEASGKIGVTKILKCVVDGIPSPEVLWTKDDVPITNTSTKHINRDHSLKLKLSAEDDGNYKCTATNSLGEASGTVKVVVYKRPKIDKSVKTVFVEQGSDAAIHCRIIEGTPYPNFFWRFKSKHGKTSKEMDEWNKKESIILKNVDKSKAGKYECVAVGRDSKGKITGHDMHYTELIVEYPPIIEKSPRTVNGKAGDTITLKCDVDAVLAAVVRWTKDKVPISETPAKLINEDHSLELKLSVEDSGKYECIASNRLGTASITIEVNVYVPAYIEPPIKNTVYLKVGEDVELPCKADGLPKPNVVWKTENALGEISHGALTDLYIARAQLNDAGHYTCIATNPWGSCHITYELTVYAPPSIVNIYPDKTFRPIEGDLVLIIKCNATGSPKPVIGWTKDGLNVASVIGNYDIDEHGTLFIRNVDTKSSGVYVCDARNRFGRDSEWYKVDVDPYPMYEPPTSVVHIEEGSSEVVECNIPHTLDTVRWYKNGRLLARGKLLIDEAKLSDFGLYVCRVSDSSRSRSGYINVKVGYKPRFTTDVEEELDFVEGYKAELDCTADAQPPAKTTWKNNGKVIDETTSVHTFHMKISNYGNYTCEVSNEFGSIQRTFNMRSKDCILSVKEDFADNQPLMFTSFWNWPLYEVVDGRVYIPNKGSTFLSCPKKFTKFPRNYANATCVGDTVFSVGGNYYKYSDLKCTKRFDPTITHTGKQCYGIGSELITVEYEALHESVIAYDICYDKNNKIPIYTKHNLGRYLADEEPTDKNWFSSDLLPYNFDEMYECANQASKISHDLGKWFLSSDKECCFSKRQLINPRDMGPGLQQSSTFTYFNVVPHWSTCNTKNWDDLEEKLRKFAKSVDYSLSVWTGTYSHLHLLDVSSKLKPIYIYDDAGRKQPVPMYLWKVVQDPVSRSSLAIVQVNVPHLSPAEAFDHLLCGSICDDITWMKGTPWYDTSRGHIFCCNIEDFEKAFGYKGVFNRGHKNVFGNPLT